MDRRKTFALLVTAILLIGAIIILFSGDEERPPHIPTIDLPPEYMVFVDSPENQDDLMFIAALSSIVVHDGYHPMFILENGSLNNYQLWTIDHLEIKDVPKLLFTNSEEVAASVSDQVENVEVFEKVPHTLMDFRGFDGYISVGSDKEALWVAPLANYDNKMITIGKPTYMYQEDVWGELESRGVSANYVIVTNPEDYRTDIFYTEGISYKNDGNAAPATPYNASFHIPSLSAVAAELAAYHQAYVLTDIDPSTEEIGYMDVELNKVQIGTYLKLREMFDDYGPMEYICLVGSAEAVPQFELPDETGAEGSAEGDGLISSDMMYGFMSDDIYFMNVAVGRIINMNAPAASNQIVRTLAYDSIIDTVEVEYSNTGTQTVNWRNHASVWNGYEVADERLQMRPGWEATRDFEDEGYVAEYMRTTGNEGFWGSVVNPGSASETIKETEIKPIMESSGFTVYRGHGSWHATFYVWEPEESTDPQGKSRLEGNDPSHPDSLVDYYLPPQVSVLVSCENNKIHGLHWWGAPIDLQMSFPLNFFNSGGVGLVAATEVSYSNLGQDLQTLGGQFTGNYNWDKNNCWFAFPLDAMINHEDQDGTIGKAGQWAENRYMNNPNKGFQVSPFERISDADGKEVAMFVVYGDPSFQPEPNRPGANSVDPWHNGPDDE